MINTQRENTLLSRMRVNGIFEKKRVNPHYRLLDFLLAMPEFTKDINLDAFVHSLLAPFFTLQIGYDY